jgi:HEAT repeats
MSVRMCALGVVAVLATGGAAGVEASERALLDRGGAQAQVEAWAAARAEARAWHETGRLRERELEEAAQARAEADRARQAERDEWKEGRQQRAEGQYEAGQEALENAQWARAAERFRQVVDAKQTRVDAAMYWLAYAQSKLAQHADALATLSELTKAFPSSRWLGDARALEIEVRQNVGQPVRPEAQADEELKLLAIQGLQHSDPAQAVPMLQKFLQGNQSPRLKERALFVLAQSSSPDARKVITDIARGNANPDLQRKAIQYIGMTGRGENRQVLSEIYQSTADVDVKRQILRAYMIAGDRERVLAAATGEKAPELRQEAVRQLGVMGAREELRQLYQKETAVEVKRQILQALFVGGDATRLIELANTEPNAELRRAAVRHLGTMGASRTGEALVALYQKEKDAEIKRTVVQALFVQGNAESLVAIARKETDIEMRKDLVQKLSLMKSKVATDYLMEILGK